MKVKIGDKVYDANKEPIMLILDEADKNNIANMHTDNYKYTAFPSEMNIDEVKNFMKLKSTE
jgi:hypothetical protein